MEDTDDGEADRGKRRKGLNDLTAVDREIHVFMVGNASLRCA